MWVVRPVVTSSASTRTPTSSDVLPTSFTEARTVTRSPTCTGWRNDISSIETVTARPPQCLIAARPAAVSTSFMIVPPWTIPATFASASSMSSTSVTREAETGFGVRSHSAMASLLCQAASPSGAEMAPASASSLR